MDSRRDFLRKITVPIILSGKQPTVPVDGEEALKDLKIMDAIFEATKSGKKAELKL